MSDTSEAVPQARSGVGVGTATRLLAIVLGIASTAIIARDGFQIPFGNLLDGILQVYEGALEYVAFIVLDPAIKAIFAKLRDWFDLNLQLYPHWKHVFVLLWLFAGSLARSVTQERMFGIVVAFGWFWGAVCALFGGVLAGSVPISEPAVFWWSIASILLFMGGFLAVGRISYRPGLGGRIMILSAIGLAAGFGFVGTSVFDASASPSLASLAFYICAMGLVSLLAGAIDPQGDGESWWQRWLGDEASRTGLDILSVLGGAAFIVWLGNALA